MQSAREAALLTRAQTRGLHVNSTTLRDHYTRLAASDDFVARGLAREQLAHLHEPLGKRGPSQTNSSRNRWPHVPLAALLEEAGNSPRRSGGRMVSGHESVHGSKSGTCVSVD